MLTEVTPIRQVRGEFRRRWFADERHDLIVWFDGDGRPRGFQFCYDRGVAERSVTMRPGRGLSHSRVDDGEAGGLGAKATPVLGRPELPAVSRALSRFLRVAGDVPDGIRFLVVSALLRSGRAPSRRRGAGRRRR